MHTCHSIKEEAVNESVLAKVREVCRAYLDPGRLRSIAQDMVEGALKSDGTVSELQAMQAKVASLAANLDQMYMDRLNGLLSEDDFRRIYQKVKSDRAALDGRIKVLSEQTKRPVDAAEKAKTLVRQFLDVAFTKREVLVSLIERVELTEEKEIIIKFRFREPEVIT